MSRNKEDNFLRGRYNTEIYRFDDTTIAIYLPSGTSTVNNLMPKFKEAKIEAREFINSNVCEEAVLLCQEADIYKINGILRFMTKGKIEQLKEHKAQLKAEAKLLKENQSKEKKKETKAKIK